MTAPNVTMLGITPTQTVGPFFWNALLRDDAVRHILAGPNTLGERLRIEGRVLDGDAAPVPDAMVEIWQANAAGRYAHPADTRPLPLDSTFTGFGRCGTDDDGRYWFETIKPGSVPFDSSHMQAPHILVAVFARGLLNHLCTRLYFADDPTTGADPVLALVPEGRRSTLLAQLDATASNDNPVAYRFDIVLQGAGETVFFNV